MAGLEERFGYHRESVYENVGQWAVKAPIYLESRPFTFERHEYLIQPYGDDHPFQVEQKATQMGCTVKALLQAFYAARYADFRRAILYYFPTRSDVSEFSKGRAAPLIEDNPDNLGSWVKDTDATHIKKVGNCFIYFRGMKSMAGLKSTPADMLIFDELDESPRTSVDKAMKRLSHSEHGIVRMLSNPTLPDFGISKAFAETDQHYWLLRCGSCGEWNSPEEVFMEAKPPETPRCFRETPEGVLLVCRHCQRELNPREGQWVPKRPQLKEKRGYHYSQLWSSYVKPGDILRDYRTTRNLTDFYNLTIGVPYVEAENRLSVEEILALCGDEGQATGDPGPCYLGMDQGKDLHVVVGKRHWQKAGQVVHLGIYRDWEELDRLMVNFKVARAVVDALPETRAARAFAERHPGKVFLCFYQEHRRGHYAWNERDLTVSVNRTESLDASHQEIQRGELLLPRSSDLVTEFARHGHNTAKRLDEDAETGSKRYVFVKLGDDHFRHAYNYEVMARQFGAGSVFGNLDLS